MRSNDARRSVLGNVPSFSPQIHTNRAGTAAPFPSGANLTASPGGDTRLPLDWTASRIAAHITSPGTGSSAFADMPSERATSASAVVETIARRSPASSSPEESSPR